jgi:hypothetical protein
MENPLDPNMLNNMNNVVQKSEDAQQAQLKSQIPAPSPMPGSVPQPMPFTNGTGSGRPVFDQMNTNNINQITQGNMPNALFGASKKKEPLTADMFYKAKADKPGASMNGGPRDGRKKPTANTIKTESTGVAKPVGWGSEQLKTDARTDGVLGMRDMGFYSDKYAKDRIAGKMGYPSSTYETVRHPAAEPTAVEKAIAKGPKKSERTLTKQLRSVKGLKPKKKLMATRTMAKAKKKPLEKMTPRPAKKL